MSKTREIHSIGDLVPVQSAAKVTVLPSNSGVIGRFLEETANMFKARVMRMGGVLRRINEHLEHDLRKQGLVSEPEAVENSNE